MKEHMSQLVKQPLKGRRGATYLWRLVERTLEQDIRTGKLEPGTPLPSELELAAKFAVHRNTVRHALAVLRERDLIRIDQGRGAFVKERVVRFHLSSTSRLMALLPDIHRVGERRFLGFDHLRSDKDLSRDLGLDGSRFVRRVDTLTLIDGRPIVVASGYFPLPRFNGIEKHIEETGSFTEAWAKYGVHEYKRAETRISAIALSKTDAAILGLPARQPMIHITNINKDRDGRPIVVFRNRAAPQFIEYAIKY